MNLKVLFDKLFPTLPDEGPPLPSGLEQKWPGLPTRINLKEALSKLGELVPIPPTEGPPLPKAAGQKWTLIPGRVSIEEREARRILGLRYQ